MMRDYDMDEYMFGYFEYLIINFKLILRGNYNV
jgi:hypothetical protein